TLTGSRTRSRKCRGMSRVVRSGRALPSNRGGGDVREVREALDVLQSQPAIALLFTDVVMPGPLDGFSLAHEAKKMHPERVRKAPRSADQPVRSRNCGNPGVQPLTTSCRARCNTRRTSACWVYGWSLNDSIRR